MGPASPPHTSCHGKKRTREALGHTVISWGSNEAGPFATADGCTKATKLLWTAEQGGEICSLQDSCLMMVFPHSVRCCQLTDSTIILLKHWNNQVFKICKPWYFKWLRLIINAPCEMGIGLKNEPEWLKGWERQNMSTTCFNYSVY